MKQRSAERRQRAGAVFRLIGIGRLLKMSRSRLAEADWRRVEFEVMCIDPFVVIQKVRSTSRGCTFGAEFGA